MTNLIHLHDEVSLVTDLKFEALGVIRGCQEINPIKILVESHDIFELSLQIMDKYPSTCPGLFIYDKSAVMHLSNLTRQLLVYYNHTLPKPEFPFYRQNVMKFLRLCEVPINQLTIVK